MSPTEPNDLVTQIERLAELASTDHQAFQLAAQRADVEGLSLAAGVLRSLSEGHAGKAHALMTLSVQLKGHTDGSVTRSFVESAMRRTAKVEQLTSALMARVDAELDARQAEDIRAIVNLTATNRNRLERLLAGLDG